VSELAAIAGFDLVPIAGFHVLMAVSERWEEERGR
jgi:hypothetical protein